MVQQRWCKSAGSHVHVAGNVLSHVARELVVTFWLTYILFSEERISRHPQEAAAHASAILTMCFVALKQHHQLWCTDF